MELAGSLVAQDWRLDALAGCDTETVSPFKPARSSSPSGLSRLFHLGVPPIGQRNRFYNGDGSSGRGRLCAGVTCYSNGTGTNPRTFRIGGLLKNHPAAANENAREC
jgi:hypothetical protein